ncbi:hypothetical protein L6164_014609 [Bauhinia variegata]|uniref:Uncharacterized protein n=1 Tax=Bauhinia variegata TaxID=167791 RepID=A0ACB9NJ49_BAUVA|nr:hypothetical protein L6164_014609 [Bauhinia variegata]
MYAIGGSKNPTIISQGNRFVAPDKRECKEVTKRDYASQSEWKNWNWRSEGDLLANGAFFVQSGKEVALPKKEMTARPASTVASLTRYAGALNCLVNKPC